jgi:DnaA family protein
MIFSATQQLILNGMRLRDDATFANYFPASNQLALAFLQSFDYTPQQWFVYLWGKPDCGCTHLLNALCLQAQQQNKSAIYLPMTEIIGMQPAILEDLENHDLICLDDIELIAGKKEWETALFHLYNRLHQAQCRLVVAADRAPRELAITLPDLHSRLTSGVTFQLHTLTDDEKLAALQLRGQARGLTISDEVGYFLLRRTSRSLGDLFQLLDKLDHASLAAQRRLTIPFVKTVLGL